MAIAIILIYDEDRHLIPKPADYKSLIAVARAKFPVLVGVANDNIAFHFTPEWFDAQVQIDDGAFSEVHDRAILRITTTGSDPAQGPSQSSIKQEGGSSLPSRKDTITIMVRYSLCGFGGPWTKCLYEVNPDDRLVVALVHHVASRFCVDADDLVLKFKEQEVDEYDSANDLGIKPGDTVDVVNFG